MIVVGVDPGGRETGLAVVDYTLLTGKIPTLLASATILRERDGTDLLDLGAGREYLVNVLAGVSAACQDFAVDGIAVEGVRRPSWFHKGKAKPTDPSAIMATSAVAGAVIGRSWSCPLVVVDPVGNGMLLPPAQYPEAIRPKSIAGKDKRRHERSGYDVAMMGSAELARAMNRRERSRPHA